MSEPDGHDGDRDLGGVHRADGEARRQAAVEQERGDDRAPRADQAVGDAARGGGDLDAARVERRQLALADAGVGVGPRAGSGRLKRRRIRSPTSEQHDGEERAQVVAVDVHEHGRAEQRADGAGDGEPEDQRPVDVAEAPVRRAGHQPGGDLGQVDRGRRGRRADARCSAGCVDDVGPNPMPSAPSTSEARNPARPTSDEVVHARRKPTGLVGNGDPR